MQRPLFPLEKAHVVAIAPATRKDPFQNCLARDEYPRIVISC